MSESHIVLIGHRGAGKTRIFQRLVESTPFHCHPPSTDTIEHAIINISSKDYHLYDTPGTKTPILIPILSKATLLLLVYDVSQHYAYHNISTWIEFISHYTSSPIILVSDQVDYLSAQKRLQLTNFSEWITKQIWVDSVRGRHMSAILDTITEHDTPILPNLYPHPQTHVTIHDPGCFDICPLRFW